LPTKIDDGAQVRSNAPSGYFVATTDSYGGNSGSSVFNYDTGEVEGVLVRGEDDYVYRNGCMVSNVCEESGCRGEDVTKISSVLPYL
jgi:V8-like Glu-specific endopeptidase